jgi:hypothetical protein
MKEIAAMESKPWYLSKTIWGAVVGVASGGLALAGHGLSSDAQAWLTDEVVQVIEAGAAVVGGLLAIYGRVKAETKIGSQ